MLFRRSGWHEPAPRVVSCQPLVGSPDLSRRRGPVRRNHINRAGPLSPISTTPRRPIAMLACLAQAAFPQTRPATLRAGGRAELNMEGSTGQAGPIGLCKPSWSALRQGWCRTRPSARPAELGRASQSRAHCTRRNPQPASRQQQSEWQVSSRRFPQGWCCRMTTVQGTYGCRDRATADPAPPATLWHPDIALSR